MGPSRPRTGTQRMDRSLRLSTLSVPENRSSIVASVTTTGSPELNAWRSTVLLTLASASRTASRSKLRAATTLRSEPPSSSASMRNPRSAPVRSISASTIWSNSARSLRSETIAAATARSRAAPAISSAPGSRPGRPRFVDGVGEGLRRPAQPGVPRPPVDAVDQAVDGRLLVERPVVGEVLEEHAADAEPVAVLEALLRHEHVVDERAVARAQVDDLVPAGHRLEAAVLGGQAAVVDADARVRRAAEHDGLVGERELLRPLGAVEEEDGAHGVAPEGPPTRVSRA